MCTAIVYVETHVKLGLGIRGAGNYEEYFGLSTDIEAVTYLMLMNQMLHDLFPSAITIGEDVSGMPTFCRCGAGDSSLNPASEPLEPALQRRKSSTGLCRRSAAAMNILQSPGAAAEAQIPHQALSNGVACL